MPEVWEQIFVGALVVLVFVAFMKEWFSPDLVAMSAFVLLILFGILDPGQALSVLGNPAPITIGCMFILSAALERTGLIEALGSWFKKVAGKTEFTILLIMMIIVAPLSAFVNNTPVVVVFMPILLSLSRELDLKASRFLIPLSYAAIAGGTCTIIGTSTNLVAAGVATDAGLEPFGMFETGKMGIFFVGITGVYLMLFGRRLLPDRVTLATLFDSEEGKEFLTQAFISEQSPLVGKLFTESPLAKMREIRIIEVVREGKPLKRPLPKICFEEGDQLLFKSHVSGVVEINATEGLDLMPGSDLGLDRVHTESAVLMEGILGPQSRLAGHSLKELNFRQRYGVLILAVHRRGENLRERFEDVKLAFGDTLLVEGPVDRMNELFAQKDFVNLSRPKQRPLRRSKAPIALAALGGFIFLASLHILPIVVLALSAALLTLLTRCIDSQDAYDSVEWKVIFMIFGMLALGKSLQVTNAAAVVSEQAVDWFGAYGPQVVLAVIYLLAAVLTEIITNNAVAALLTPLAIAVGVQLGVDPRPFVVAVMFGSSASFMTPIGYQTNTFVYGAGGYKFTDFMRVGAPLALILWIAATLLIPVLWPF